MAARKRLVYKSSTFINEMLMAIVRVLLAGLIVYCLYHYKENPPVVIGVTVILLLLFFLTGSERILVYEDRVIFQIDSIFGSFRPYKKIYLDKVKAISYRRAMPIPAAVSRNGWRNMMRSHDIIIDYHSGEWESINTDIYIGELKNIIKAIQSQIEKKGGA